MMPLPAMLGTGPVHIQLQCLTAFLRGEVTKEMCQEVVGRCVSESTTTHRSPDLNNRYLPSHVLTIVTAGEGAHEDGGLVPGKVVVIKLWEACIQMALWKINGT